MMESKWITIFYERTGRTLEVRRQGDQNSDSMEAEDRGINRVRYLLGSPPAR